MGGNKEKQKMKIVFIILNYNTYEETKECVLSIEDKLDTKDYRIVIVDNCSSDGSADKLTEFIKCKEQIEILRNPENLGFARGNNAGIRYVNKKYNPEYVAVINSDTEIISENLTEVLDKEYKKTGFAVFGPLVLNENGRCDLSPVRPRTEEDLIKALKRVQQEEKAIKIGMYLFYSRVLYLKRFVSERVFKKQNTKIEDLFSKRQEQLVLNGCFLVFSNKAFSYIDGFDDRTFLYCEENILYFLLMKHGLTTVFSPEIIIYHKCGCATDKLKNQKKEKMLLLNKYLEESLKVEWEVIKENQKREKTQKRVT